MKYEILEDGEILNIPPEASITNIVDTRKVIIDSSFQRKRYPIKYILVFISTYINHLFRRMHVIDITRVIVYTKL